MAKKEVFTLNSLKDKGMIEVSPGVFQKVSNPQPRDKVKLEWKEVKPKLEATPKNSSIYVKTTINNSELHFTKEDIKGIGKEPYNFPLTNRCHIRLELKPLSVNNAWRGRRFKTPEYIAYERSAISVLPNIFLPNPPYKLILIFAVSNKASDIDNPVKLLIDILQKRYQFNDKEIYELSVKKIIVKKRKEYCEFKFESL